MVRTCLSLFHACAYGSQKVRLFPPMAQPVAECVVFPDWLVSVSRVPLDDGRWESVAFGCCRTGGHLLVFWHENGFNTVGSTESPPSAPSGVLRHSSKDF